MKKTITAAQAENLAICYNAFTERMRGLESTRTGAWAGRLKQAQEETGIEMTSSYILDFFINRPEALQ